MKAGEYLEGKNRKVVDIALDSPTPASTLDARAAEISRGNPLSGVTGLGKNLLELGDAFGIQKRDVGVAVLKGITSGKFELPGMKSETSKRKKLEVAVDQIIKLIWTCFGIFMIFQVFTFIVSYVA